MNLRNWIFLKLTLTFDIRREIVKLHTRLTLNCCCLCLISKRKIYSHFTDWKNQHESSLQAWKRKVRRKWSVHKTDVNIAKSLWTRKAFWPSSTNTLTLSHDLESSRTIESCQRQRRFSRGISNENIIVIIIAQKFFECQRKSNLIKLIN
jgi:hypothetical protein